MFYGVDGGFSSRIGSGLHKSIWENVIGSGVAIDTIGVPLCLSFLRDVKSGGETLFWNDIWTHSGQKTLDEVSELSRLNGNLVLSSEQQDGWRWKLNPNGKFTVNNLSKLIDIAILGPNVMSYKFHRRPTAKGVGLRVASSHTGNHHEDDFTPLETIQRFLSIFGSKSHTSSKERPSTRRGRYPTSVSVFPDPILFLDGLKPSWENFMYADTDEDLSFLPKESCLDDGTGSLSVSINTEPPLTVVEATEQLVENTADSGGSPQREKLVLHTGSVAGRIKVRKCKTRGGSSRPPVKHKLVHGTSSSRSARQKTSRQIDSSFIAISDDDEGLPDVFELQDATAFHLKIYAITPPAWKGHLDNQLDLKLFDLHDRCYARQTVIDNAVNQCEELRIKCEEAMTDFDKNPNVVALREKIIILQGEVKDYRANLDKMLLKSQKWSGYQVSLSTLESKVASLEAEKVRVESVEASLRQDLENAKRDRADFVSKVVPYVATELVQSDDMGKLVAKLVNASIFYGRCHAFEEVAKMKEPFDITKVKGYRSSYKQEHTKAGNDLATATFPFLTDVVADPYAFIEKATPSPTPMSPPPQVNPATASSSKAQSPHQV
ncbi:hypothetical protein Tco_0671956 [Tanacetum coccineum]